MLVCYIFRHIVELPVYVIPVFSAVCSIVLLFSSFFKGGWGGMGLGAIGLVLLLASVLPFMLSALFLRPMVEKNRELSGKRRHMACCYQKNGTRRSVTSILQAGL
ncbi:YesK family protein [Weizmannia coagulans]|uniref:Uncharacterized protein n=3 Tax=Heyndrickxia TaxID=2837504 RepID=A0AAN0T540_HEYCO|nr:MULTISPECIES: YesK family protein [Heyndrickxia]AJO23077.1 hypothetical protein SB48_HM08orf03598 [Heyndrickxia coagulans]MCR4446184.1 hypothetical protein [Heyndrickxia coagulans]MCW8783844.1 YesK family protein [Heyndrickxia coagulans]MDL4845131.1 YesK family protein [Heyndrickxia coagulans]MEC2224015.1 YesK family protein [Weizmannia sp. CD-2023]